MWEVTFLSSRPVHSVLSVMGILAMCIVTNTSPVKRVILFISGTSRLLGYLRTAVNCQLGVASTLREVYPGMVWERAVDPGPSWARGSAET